MIKIPSRATDLHAYHGPYERNKEASFVAMKADLRAAVELFPNGQLQTLPATKRAAAISYAASGGDVETLAGLIASRDWAGCIDLILEPSSDEALMKRRTEEADLFSQGCNRSRKRLRKRTRKPPPPPTELAQVAIPRTDPKDHRRFVRRP